MKSIILAALAFAMAQTACGQISDETVLAYNQTLADGSDANTIKTAALALADTAIANPEDEQATLLAFEAGVTLCRIGACEASKPAATFVVNQPVISAEEFPTGPSRQVLLQYVNWKSDPTERRRKTLTGALETLAAEDISIISIMAHRDNYEYCTQKGAWGDASRAATAAFEHFEAAQNEIYYDYASAKVTAYAASFNMRQSLDLYEPMARLERDISQRATGLEASAREQEVKRLRQVEYLAMAWKGAMGAYLTSSGKGRAVGKIDERLRQEADEDEETQSSPAEDAALSGELPFCEEEPKELPSIRYPSRAANRGIVGSLVMGFDLNAEGRPENIEVLAAVPLNAFDEVSIEAIAGLQWERAEGVAPETCRLSRENVVYPFVFTLN